MIGQHANRGSLRLRSVATPEQPAPQRNISPAIVVAIVIHAALVAGLAAWKAPALIGAAHSEFVSATITFVGLREPDSAVGGGGGRAGNPHAGGRGARQTRPPKLGVSTPPVARLEMPPLPHVQPRLPPIIAVETTAPVPFNGFLPTAPPASVFVEGTGSSSGDGTGTGFGNGTGKGVGDGFADGIAGSGTGTGTGIGTGSGDGVGDGVGFGGANYLRSPQPHYPAIARQQGWEGTTVLRVEIRADGKIGAIQIIQSAGHKVLDDAAIDAVRAAQFQPARHNGTPITSWVEVPVTFRLNRG